MEELKPCPFCNRKVSIKKVSIPFDAVGSAKIAQCECGVFLNHTRWNTRPIEDQLRAENERLREAMGLLQNWAKAYPLEMFPEPDLKLARKLLTDGGVSYGALNVYSMRHVINGVDNIIKQALNEVTK